MSSVRIALIGNCQVQTLTTIAKSMLDDVDIRVMDYSDRSSRDEDVRRDFADTLDDRDFIFAQTALLNHTSERDLRARFGPKVVTIANFYFRGLFPDSCYVGDFAHRLDQPSSVNSIIVLDAFRRGLTPEQAVASFSAAAFERLNLFDAWASSVHEMGLREANNVIDVRGGAMMEEACRTYPAFHTMNHPTASLLAEYAARMFAFAGLRHNHIDIARLPDPLAEHDTTPVLDLVAEHYELPFRTSQTWRLNSVGRRFISLEEYVGRCYQAYAAARPGSLLCHSPADMVPALRADPALAYLVDASTAVPDAGSLPSPPPAQPRPAWTPPPPVLPGGGEIQTSLDELKLFIHKVHSYLEVADPKVEAIAQALPRLEAARSPPVVEPARQAMSPRVMAILAVCSVVGGLVGSLVAGLL